MLAGIVFAEERRQALVETDGQRNDALTLEEFVVWARQLKGKARRIVACYEAGCFGYVLYRRLVALGIECLVVAPRKWDQGVKTDARELCSNLDRYLNGNRKALTVVHVPTEEQERRRSLSRQRPSLSDELQRIQNMGTSHGPMTPCYLISAVAAALAILIRCYPSLIGSPSHNLLHLEHLLGAFGICVLIYAILNTTHSFFAVLPFGRGKMEDPKRTYFMMAWIGTLGASFMWELTQALSARSSILSEVPYAAGPRHFQIEQFAMDVPGITLAAFFLKRYSVGGREG